MAASAVFLVGATLMTAANGSMDMVIVGRAIAGLGIGACSLVVPVYISETAPPSVRGRLVGIFEIASQGGGMLGKPSGSFRAVVVEMVSNMPSQAFGSTMPLTERSTSRANRNGSSLWQYSWSLECSYVWVCFSVLSHLVG